MPHQKAHRYLTHTYAIQASTVNTEINNTDLTINKETTLGANNHAS